MSAEAGHPCPCYNCAAKRDEGRPLFERETMARMILCPTCGCKRCPHSTDHSLACTGSNEPGQPGSRYGGLPPDGALSRQAQDAPLPVLNKDSSHD